MRLQKLFYEVTFVSQILTVDKGKIEILVSISVFVEDSKSLLPTLGRSANLSEPWAPRKELSRRYATFYLQYTNRLAISNF